MRHKCSTKGCTYKLDKAGKCPKCLKEKYRQDDLMRGSANERGYDSEHQRQRKRMIPRDAFCVRCGTTQGPFQLDHIVPLAAGGSNNIANKQVLCATCNRDKSDNIDW